jgi:hypothetical protein
MEKGDWIAVISIILIILIGVAVYFTFFFAYTCNDLSCFQAHQKQCARTEFVKDSTEITWKYFIKGKEDGRCVVNAEVLRIKTGTVENIQLVGKDMDCYLPLGSTAAPESDISRCHGILKEDMQNMIIQKLHAYILDNLGEISEGLEQVI